MNQPANKATIGVPFENIAVLVAPILTNAYAHTQNAYTTDSKDENARASQATGVMASQSCFKSQGIDSGTIIAVPTTMVDTVNSNGPYFVNKSVD